jgi:ankyrin repeat protein
MGNSNGNINLKLLNKKFFDFCKNGQLELAKLLLKNKPDIDINACGGNYNTSALSCAANNGHYKAKLLVVKYLVSLGANINFKNNNEETPLIFATGGGHFMIVKYLVEKGADIHIVNCRGLDAFSHAILQNNLEIANYLSKQKENQRLQQQKITFLLGIESSWND